MPQLHVVTVGTSLVRNAATHGRGVIREDLLQKFSRWASAPLNSLEDAEAGGRASPGTEEFEAALTFVNSDPYRASAELNAMKPYLEAGLVSEAVLLSTDSGVSFFCASVLEEYLEGSGVKVEKRRVPQLGVDFDEGFYNLLDEVARAASDARRRGLDVYLNLTGGFKPESAALYALAPLVGASRAYYVHEYTRRHVELPIVPLAIPEELRGLAAALGGEAVDPSTLSPSQARLLERLEREGIVRREGDRYRVRAWVALALRLRP